MVGTVKKSMAATSPILQICRTCEVEARSGAVSSTVEPWSLPVLDGQIRMRDQPLRRQVREAILPVGMAPRQGTPVDFVCCCYCSLLLQNGTTAVVFAYFGPLLVLLIRRGRFRSARAPRSIYRAYLCRRRRLIISMAPRHGTLFIRRSPADQREG